MATITKAELQDKYDALLASAEKHEADRKAFIEKIIDVAGRAAREHDLCDVLEETFGELGIDLPGVNVIVTETKTFTLSGFEAYRRGFVGEDVSQSDIRTEMSEAIEYGYIDPDKSEVIDVSVVSA